MDIGANELVYLRRALLGNSVVLFTGAGFSFDATNIRGRPMPSGTELNSQLWEYLGYPSPPADDLKRTFQAALKTSHANLRILLRDNFECKAVKAWYSIVPQFFWYRIYTTNIDDVMERVYLDVNGLKLRRIDGQRDDFCDRDQFLGEIQYIKLNGIDWNSPSSLTFGFSQYARRAGDAPVWYAQLARDFVTRTVLFVGSELDEPLFWQAVELRGRKHSEGEQREKAFWIKPAFSPAAVDALKTYNVTPICATAEEFFNFLHGATDRERDRREVLLAAHPEYSVIEQKAAGTLRPRQLRELEQFYSVFSPVRIPDRAPPARKSFLLGATPDWPTLLNNLDAPRTCGDDLASIVAGALSSPSFSIISVTGYAGSGKSTTLMRLALKLRAAGHLVFWSDSEEAVPKFVLASALSHISGRAILFCDNASQIRGPLLEYIEAASAAGIKPLLIVSDRANAFSYTERALTSDYNVIRYSIPNLSEQDVIAVLDTLERNGLLGRLLGLPRKQQIAEISIRAGKQLLVAMREATKGVDFDTILESEFASLPSDEIRIVYAAVCIATAAGYSISEQQFVSLSDLQPNATLSLLADELKEIVVTVRRARTGLVARHRIIAQAMADVIVARGLLEAAYIRLLAVISRDVPADAKVRSQGFRMYREIINHRLIWQRFEASIDRARHIYDSVRAHFNNDFHFWLQYGSLELEFGELELADAYISSAEGLAPDDFLVQCTKALLLYKRACKSDRVVEARSMRDAARAILVAHCASRPSENHPPHILHSQEFAYINTWMQNPAERKRALETLRSDIDRCCKEHQYSERLAQLQKAIHHAYLELAISRQ